MKLQDSFRALLLIAGIILAQAAHAQDENPFTGIEGNWIATFENSPGTAQVRVSIWPKTFDENGKRDWQFKITDTAGGSIPDMLEIVSINEQSLQLRERFSEKENNKMDTISVSAADENTLTGTWINNHQDRGKAVFRRVIPAIKYIEITSGQAEVQKWMYWKMPRHSSVSMPGGIPTAEYTYHYQWWPDESNEMRGNRPYFYLNLYGDNLWGVLRSSVKGDPRFEFQLPGSYTDSYITNIHRDGNPANPIVGRRIQVHLWGEPKPGRYEVNVNGVKFPLDLLVHGYPPPPVESLVLVNPAGEPIPILREGEFFAIEARHEEPNDVQTHYVAMQVLMSGEIVSIDMVRQADARFFRSDFLRLAGPAPETHGEEIAMPEAVAAVIRDHYSGNWVVRQAGESETAMGGGSVSIASDGRSGVMALNAGGRSRDYTLLDASAEIYEGASTPAYLVTRFAPDSAIEDPYGEASVRPLRQPRDSSSLVIRAMTQELEVPVEWNPDNEDSGIIEYQFPSPARSWLEGSWQAERALGVLGVQGDAWWTRGPPRIRKVLVLEDQIAADMRFGYPREGGQPGENWMRRRLMIIGENLPVRQATQSSPGTVPLSADPKIKYTGLALDKSSRELLMRQTFDDQKLSRPENMDVLVVNAEFERGVTAGRKGLSIAGATGHWPLRFNDDHPDLRFTRDRNFGPGDEIAVAYPGDTAFLTLDLDYDIHLADRENAELMIIAEAEAGSRPLLLGHVDAPRVSDETKPTFRTKPLAIAAASGDLPPSLKKGDQTTVSVKPGWRLIAVPRDEAFTVEAASLTVELPDAEIGKLWLDTLKNVSRCPGVRGDIDKPKEFAMEPGDAFSKGIYVSRLFTGDTRNNDITLRNGDHAAAILIRDEYIRQMDVLLPRYEAQAEDPRQVRAFWEKARHHPGAPQDAFWKHNTVRALRFPGGLPLSEVLDVERLAGRLGVTETEATQWALEQTQAALRNRVENMSTAIIRAKNSNNCDLDEIMVFAGYNAPRVIQAITARLVVKKDGRWVPDDQAIRFVKGLHVAGSALRALAAYSDIDNTYNAMAFAVVTAGATVGLGVGGLETAATYTSFIGNTIDATVIGGMGVRDYFRGERAFETAEGIAPVFGDQVVADAAAQRKNALMTALGVLFPLRGAAGEISELRRAGGIARGKALAESGTLENLDQLSDAQRADLAAFYDELLGRRFGLGRSEGPIKALSSEEIQTYRDLNALFNAKAARSADTPATSVAASETRPPPPDDAPGATPIEAPPPETPAGPRLPDALDPTESPTLAYDPNKTIEVNPNTTDPSEMRTQVVPEDQRPTFPREEVEPQPRTPQPDEATPYPPPENIGKRTADIEDPDGYLESLIEKGRRGEALTPDEIQDKIDLMRRRNAANPGTSPIAEQPPAYDPNKTIEVNPNTTDPSEMRTQVVPEDQRPTFPREEVEPQPRTPGPDEATPYPPPEDIGKRTAEIEDPDGYLESLIEKGRRGEALSPDEIQDKIDLMRMRNVSGQEPGIPGRVSRTEPSTPAVPVEKTERYTPEEVRQIAKEGEANRSMPSSPPAPVDSGATAPPPGGGVPPDDPTGSFGVQPFDPSTPFPPLKADPEIKLRDEMASAQDLANAPHQGRQSMDALAEAEHRYSLHRELDDLKAQEEIYALESPHPADSLEYTLGLEKLRNEWKARIEAMQRGYQKKLDNLARDHDVLDEVERHLGNRTRDDYFVLDVERGRPNRVISREEGVLGTLYNRFSRRAGTPLQGTPAQHKAAMEATGLTREQMRGLLGNWIDPLQRVKDPAELDRVIGDYLDWAGF